MRFPFQRYAAAVAAMLLLLSSNYATDEISNPRRNQYTKVYQKSRDGVVCVKVHRPGRSKAATGSGIIVDERGIVITNRHVVGDSTQVRVNLADGSAMTGHVVAVEPDKDLAVIVIQSNTKLTALTLAPAKDLIMCESVMAIGHPLGYSNSVTRGIISALNREITLPNGVVLKGLIQTDASINPGNSGGPLLNMNGEVIGVNVALREDAQGIAFAINSDTVKEVLRKHLSAARLAGVRVGMNFEEKVIAETGDRQRVVVTSYKTSELQQGDQILQVGDVKIRHSFDLERSLWETKPGQTVAVRVLRNGDVITVQLPLFENPYGTQIAASRAPLIRVLNTPYREAASMK